MSFSYHPIDADVIVIGAGISGLTTALTLLEREPTLGIIILEAEDRIGGRLLSAPLPSKSGDVLDLGGQWVSSMQTQLMELLDKLEIPVATSLAYRNKIFVDYNGKIWKLKRKKALNFCNPYDKFQLVAFIATVEGLCTKTALDPKLVSQTMEDFINENVKSDAAANFIKHLILSHCGVPASELTVSFYVFFCTSTQGIFHQLITTEDGLREYWITGGAQEICNKIAGIVHEDHIVKNQQVIAVEVNNSEVKVETQDYVFYAFYVVMAVPPLAVPKIKFSPALPKEKLWALSDSVAGHLTRFVITYETAFWRELGYCGDIFVLSDPTPDRPLVCCFDVFQDTPALSGYFIGAAGKYRKKILEQLAEYLGNDALSPLQYVEKAWQTGSPMACFSCAEDVYEFQAKFERIFWGGAETSTEWYGCIAGAVQAGYRAAIEVLYDLRPASLTRDDMTIIMPLRRRKKVLKSYTDIYKRMMKWYVAVPLGFVVAFLLLKMYRTRYYARIGSYLKVLVKKLGQRRRQIKDISI